MANSKLLKEAIADAKAVRETAIANAKIALEEAFTPRLQSILSKKLQAEMEGEEEDTMEEELDSSDIGNGDNSEPSADASDAHTELGPETEEETSEVGDELEEEVVTEEEDSEETMEEGEGSIDDPTNADDATISEEEVSEETTISEEEEVEEGYHEEEEIEEDEEEDELDLEAIIKELEMGMDSEEEVEETYHEEEEDEMHEEEEDEMHEDEDEMDSEEEADEEEADEEDDMDDEIDLDEILREMGYGDDEEVEEGYHEGEEEEANEEVTRLQTELEEALSTVKTLQSTINEVNLLNAKLLYANRLFRAYNLNNEQKSKVVENLDRTTSVREVKLVYATLAESMNFTGTEKKTKKVVSEGASKPVASTAPAKEIISENTNVLAERFKQLANIK